MSTSIRTSRYGGTGGEGRGEGQGENDRTDGRSARPLNDSIVAATAGEAGRVGRVGSVEGAPAASVREVQGPGVLLQEAAGVSFVARA